MSRSADCTYFHDAAVTPPPTSDNRLDYDVRWLPSPAAGIYHAYTPNDRCNLPRPSRPHPAHGRPGRYAQEPVRRLCRTVGAGLRPGARRPRSGRRPRRRTAARAGPVPRRPDHRLAGHGHRPGALERSHRRLAARGRRGRPADVRHLLRPPAPGSCPGRQGGLQPRRPRGRHPDGRAAARRRRRQTAGRPAAHLPGPDAACADRAAVAPPAPPCWRVPTWTRTR